jgi:hypothetical protein
MVTRPRPLKAGRDFSIMAAKSNKSDNYKKRLLGALTEHGGNVSKACESANVNRTTFYRYRDEDPDFLQAVKDIEESNIDTAEKALMDLITGGNVTAIIFFLKTKGKQRGYIEPHHVPPSQGSPTAETNQLPTTFYGHVTFSSTSTKPPIQSEDEIPDS